MLLYWMYVNTTKRPTTMCLQKQQQQQQNKNQKTTTTSSDYELAPIFFFLIFFFQAVFHVEYVDHHSQGSSKQQSVCNDSRRPSGFTTLIKDWDLTAWRLTCPLSSSASAGFPRLTSVLLLAILPFVNQAML